MYGSQTVNVFFQLYLNHAVRVVWDWKDPLGHAIYLAAKFPLASLMPLLVLQLALDNTEDGIYCFCWDTVLSKCTVHRQLACPLPCPLPSSHIQTLPVFAFKSCFWPTLMLSVTCPKTVKVSAPVFLNGKGFWGECVFVFRIQVEMCSGWWLREPSP